MLIQTTVLTFIASATIATTAFAQTSYTKQLSAHIAPLSILDPFPRWRVGVDLDAGEQLGLTLDLGIATQLSIWDNEAYKLIEVRPEVQYYFRGRKRIAPYSSAELFYINGQKRLENGRYDKFGNGLLFAYDAATFKKRKLGIHIKIGLRFHISRDVWVEGYYGLGVAHRRLRFTHVMGLRVAEDQRQEWFSAPNESNKAVLQLPCGFKIGVVLFDGQDK